MEKSDVPKRAESTEQTEQLERAALDEKPEEPKRKEDDMTTMTEATYTGRELRWLADSYEQAQRIRIETGERLRAVLQGRDETFVPLGSVEAPEDGDPYWIDPDGNSWADADKVLTAIKAGDNTGPVPILGRTYRRHHTEERELYRDMMSALKAHPAWEWLEKVRGIGPTLGCKILARLDLEKAPNPSSFWAYCGLATVPGEKYCCETCGLVRAWPVGYNVTGTHTSLGGSGKCKGSLVKVAGPDDGVRCAQPKARRGEKASYDAYAKKIMYLVATSFLKAGGPYEEFYRRERAKAERERPGWADGRKHHLALRKTEKLFLSHLWATWREAVGLSPVGPWIQEHGEHEGMIDPSEMVE